MDLPTPIRNVNARSCAAITSHHDSFISSNRNYQRHDTPYLTVNRSLSTHSSFIRKERKGWSRAYSFAGCWRNSAICRGRRCSQGGRRRSRDGGSNEGKSGDLLIASPNPGIRVLSIRRSFFTCVSVSCTTQATDAVVQSMSLSSQPL